MLDHGQENICSARAVKRVLLPAQLEGSKGNACLQQQLRSIPSRGRKHGQAQRVHPASCCCIQSCTARDVCRSLQRRIDLLQEALLLPARCKAALQEGYHAAQELVVAVAKVAVHGGQQHASRMAARGEARCQTRCTAHEQVPHPRLAR